MIEKMDRFPAGDFDEWAPKYDQDVLSDVFPFDGYTDVLNTVLRLAEAQSGEAVLDLGVGTGNLLLLFAGQGCRLYGTDYSPRMLEEAQNKLAGAILVQADLREAWPRELGGPFERIVSAYVFHHFELAEKISILKQLTALLTPSGRIIIADIAFSTQQALEAVRTSVGSDWEDEYYWIAEEALPELGKAGLAASFQPVSSCAGVFVIQKP